MFIFFITLSIIRSFIIKDILFRNRIGPSFSYDISSIDPNIKIAIELNQILSTITCIEEASIRKINSLISIVKLVDENIGTKENKTCM